MDDPVAPAGDLHAVGVSRLDLRTVPGVDDEELLRGPRRRPRALGVAALLA